MRNACLAAGVPKPNPFGTDTPSRQMSCFEGWRFGFDNRLLARGQQGTRNGTLCPSGPGQWTLGSTQTCSGSDEGLRLSQPGMASGGQWRRPGGGVGIGRCTVFQGSRTRPRACQTPKSGKVNRQAGPLSEGNLPPCGSVKHRNLAVTTFGRFCYPVARRCHCFISETQFTTTVFVA